MWDESSFKDALLYIGLINKILHIQLRLAFNVLGVVGLPWLPQKLLQRRDCCTVPRRVGSLDQVNLEDNCSSWCNRDRLGLLGPRELAYWIQLELVNLQIRPISNKSLRIAMGTVSQIVYKGAYNLQILTFENLGRR